MYETVHAVDHNSHVLGYIIQVLSLLVFFELLRGGMKNVEGYIFIILVLIGRIYFSGFKK